MRIALEVERGRRVDEPTRFELRGRVLRRAEEAASAPVVLWRVDALELGATAVVVGGRDEVVVEDDGMVYAFVE